MHCASPVWTNSKQEVEIQISPVKKDQYTQTSDVQLKQLILDLEQLSKKLTAAVLQRSASSIEREVGLSLDSQEQQSHQASAQAVSFPLFPTHTQVETCYSLEGLSEESQQALNMAGLC